MIEPISCCRKPGVNFKGANNNNFTGVNTASTLNYIEAQAARDTYSTAVQDAKDLKYKFTAPQGVGENLNING